MTFTAVDAGGSQESTGRLDGRFFSGLRRRGAGHSARSPTTATARIRRRSPPRRSALTRSPRRSKASHSLAPPASITISNFVQVTSNPTNQVAAVGQSVTFTAGATGTPAPTVQWQVSTDGGDTFTNLAGATSTTLTFIASASQNADLYRAVFTNSSASATTIPASLTVNAKGGGLVISDSAPFPAVDLTLPFAVPGLYGGATVLTLTTGNVIVTGNDASGAIFLFNGETGALISTLFGADAVTLLTNGNFVATGPGSATWGSGINGVSGTVSSANSLIDPGASSSSAAAVRDSPGEWQLHRKLPLVEWRSWGHRLGQRHHRHFRRSLGCQQSGRHQCRKSHQWGGSEYVTALPDGNYVVIIPDWFSRQGAVTWGSGEMGVAGTISADNSLIGLGEGFSVTVLSNGNYVVADPNAGSEAGLAIWASGATGVAGVASADNALAGMPDDPSGDDELGVEVTPLTNGNYVVSGYGTATWVNGTTGLAGTVSEDNSLVGGGSGISEVTPLSNGNYVVDNTLWDGGYGAVTWCDGETGTDGTVSASNSLVGSAPSDSVGDDGVTVLPNGNYVVASHNWNNGTGAVTWGSGTKGIIGTVSAANSIVGSRSSDFVGDDGVTALPNGNYVVLSPVWDNGTGAATWGNGITGTAETVSASNSLIGITSATSGGQGDEVQGDAEITVLTNGNYVVANRDWNGLAGFATWENGMSAAAGIVSAANSLIGTERLDYVGASIVPLANGNFVVNNFSWHNNDGAVTWGNGDTGVDGIVSAANSLVGTPMENVTGAIALPNGNYFTITYPPVGSAGADTEIWASGTTGIAGTVPLATGVSVAGYSANVLPNSSYIVGGTWFNGATGSTLDGQNSVDNENSLGVEGESIEPLGTGGSFVGPSDNVGGQGQPVALIGVMNPNEFTYAVDQGQTITIPPGLITNALDAGTDVTLQANDDITVTSPIVAPPTGNAGNLTLEAGRSIVLDASIDTSGGNLSLVANDSVADGVIDSHAGPGAADITMAPGTSVNTGAGTLSVDLANSTDKTNNTSGTVTLLAVAAGATAISGTSTLGITINGPNPGDGTTAGTYTQLHVSGPINLEGESLIVTVEGPVVGGAVYTIVKATGGVSGTFRGVPDGAVIVASNGTKFTISYKADGGTAVVLIAAGTGGPLPQVSGVGPAAGLAAGGTLVTITGSNLANAVSVNFGTTAVTSFASDSATQIVVMSPAGSGAVDVTVGTVSGTSSASSADEFSFVAALAQFAFSSPAVTVNENAGAATLTVVRSGGYEGATSVLVFTYWRHSLGRELYAARPGLELRGRPKQPERDHRRQV